MSQESKTETPCDCGWLAMAINDPHSGVNFDTKSNRIVLGRKSLYSMYHCPFCGGRFPDPDGPAIWVPIIPEDDRPRLEQMIADLESAEAIISALGMPDHDETDAHGMRTIEYCQLSDWFNVEFYLHAGDRSLHKRLTIKPKSARGG